MLLGIGVFFVISLLAVIYIVQAVVGSSSSSSLLSGSDEITLIEIQGPIYQSDDVVRRIKRFRKSSRKAMILRLNSPGGLVAPSQEIYSEVLRAREAKKIVVASMADVAASGAYYIAAACDKIVANPGTLTASIGVIAKVPDASSLFKKIGLNYETVKSGKLKDMGSPNKPMTPEERAYLQELVGDLYGQFLGAVLDSRGKAFRAKLAERLKKDQGQITDAQVRGYVLPYADGRGMTGQKAFELGFVDKLGNYYDAVRLTADLAGIKGEPAIQADKPTRLNQLFSELSSLSIFTRPGGSFQLEYRAF